MFKKKEVPGAFVDPFQTSQSIAENVILEFGRRCRARNLSPGSLRRDFSNADGNSKLQWVTSHYNTLLTKPKLTSAEKLFKEVYEEKNSTGKSASLASTDTSASNSVSSGSDGEDGSFSAWKESKSPAVSRRKNTRREPRKATLATPATISSDLFGSGDAPQKKKQEKQLPRSSSASAPTLTPDPFAFEV
jgi:hypothetical protein